jgi:hypothetical protein
MNEKIISLKIVLILKIRLEWVQILFHSSPRLCGTLTDRISYAGIYLPSDAGAGCEGMPVAAYDTG